MSTAIPSKEAIFAKAINTRVHQLEGQETDWKEKWKILLISGSKEDIVYVVFTAMQSYADQMLSSQQGIRDDLPFAEKAFCVGFLNADHGDRFIVDVIPEELIPKWERCKKWLIEIGIEQDESRSQPTPINWPTDEEIRNAAPNTGVNDLTGRSFGDERYEGFMQAIDWLKSQSSQQKEQI
jgi:hypothetical protein